MTRFANMSRIILAMIFAWTAGAKILWPAEFRESMDNLGMVPPRVANGLQFGLPVLELLVAGALTQRRLLLPAYGIAMFLGMVFLGVHTMLLILGTPVSCGCAGFQFSRIDGVTHWIMLAVSAGIFAMAMIGIFTIPRSASPASTGPVI